MGSSTSIAQPQTQPQAQPWSQCSVEPVKLEQIPIGCKCGKWSCEKCASMLCDRCKDKDRSANGHVVIDITTIQVKILDVTEYPTIDYYYMNLTVANDNSLWIGGEEVKCSPPFTTPPALHNVKLAGDKVKAISSFYIIAFCVAVTPGNDILLATFDPRLK